MITEEKKSCPPKIIGKCSFIRQIYYSRMLAIVFARWQQQSEANFETRVGLPPLLKVSVCMLRLRDLLKKTTDKYIMR